MEKVICTWFFEQTVAEGGVYAQVSGDSSAERYRDVYRRCIAAFFVSARKVNPESRLILYLNREWRPEASRVAGDVFGVLGELGVEMLVTDYSFSPPTTWNKAWRNQFFVFDVLEDLVTRTGEDSLVVVLDSDIVWAPQNVERLWERVAAEGALSYCPIADLDEDINGICQGELGRVAREITGIDYLPDVVRYSGGEFIALRGDLLKQVVSSARLYWPAVLKLHKSDRLRFFEEAHLLSVIYAGLDVEVDNADKYIRRIWTSSFGYNTADRSDLMLCLLHVPAEKQYGLRRLYSQIIRERRGGVAVNWNEVPRRFLGVPRSSKSKVIRDLGVVLDKRLRAAATSLRLKIVRRRNV